jgi:hypothetical protein
LGRFFRFRRFLTVSRDLEDGPTLDSSSESRTAPSRKTVKNGGETVEKRWTGRLGRFSTKPTGDV